MKSAKRFFPLSRNRSEHNGKDIDKGPLAPGERRDGAQARPPALIRAAALRRAQYPERAYPAREEHSRGR